MGKLVNTVDEIFKPSNTGTPLATKILKVRENREAFKPRAKRPTTGIFNMN
jgi:hypothetical protein